MTPLLATPQVRNVYLLVDYGDFVDGSMNTIADPYVQLLSITDPTAAHADFVNVRLNGNNSNNNSPSDTVEALRAKPKAKPRPTVDLYQPSSNAHHINNTANTQSTSSHADGALRASPRPTMIDNVYQPNSNSSSNSNVKGAFLKEKIPIIIVSSIGGALVLIGLVAVCCSRDRLGKRGRGGIANTYQSYQRLGAPAPAGDMHQVRGYHGHGGPSIYTNSWGRR